MDFRHAVEIPVPRVEVFRFFYDLEKWFRLNPQWTVLLFEQNGETRQGCRFQLKVEYDRSEVEVTYSGTVEDFNENESMTIYLEGDFPRQMTLEVRGAGEGSFLKYREIRDQEPSVQEKTELNLWLKSVGNYVLIKHRKSMTSRVWRWFIDRFWLKMSPSGRRTVFFVVCAEALSLVFFLLILVWLLIFKTI